MHGEKKFSCDNCDKKFALAWQQKYHCKYCGTLLSCQICNKVYKNPMSLLMHCKRASHTISHDKNAKSKNVPTNANILMVYVPVIINNDSTTKSANKSILPKIQIANDNSSLNSLLDSNVLLNKAASNKNVSNSKLSKSLRRKRSMDCQTIRKRNRPTNNFQFKSIETQTLHSSFDLKKVDNQQRNIDKLNNKCSSFTQTLLDDQEFSNSLIAKDLLLSSKSNDINLDGMSKSEFDSNFFENYNTTETQTNNPANGFDSYEIPMAISSECENKLKFSDLEFIDIETQTNWHYDRTTQTEEEEMIDNWYLNL